MSNDGGDSAILILMKISHFDRTPQYVLLYHVKGATPLLLARRSGRTGMNNMDVEARLCQKAVIDLPEES